MSANAALLSLIGDLARVPVLVVGDVILDHFHYGHVERISPEAPVPVLKVEREVSMLGGAGNVARNILTLGAAPDICAVVGVDGPAAAIKDQVIRAGIGHALPADPTRRTSVKIRYVSGTQQMLRVDHETVEPLAPDTREGLLAAVGKALPACKAVVLSDYGKGVLDDGVAELVIAAARDHGCPVIVDPKGRDFGRYRGAAMVTPNRKELALATAMPTGTDAEVEAAARTVIETCGIAAVLATRGPDGMTLITGDDAPVHLRSEAREVFDVSGAGDTVVAVMAAALGAGLTAHEGARLANVAAGVVVGKLGTATVTPSELAGALRHQDIAIAELKQADLHQALERVAAWRAKGLKVGFTNGCFDLLHPGHVSLLRQAKAQCDRLVVGLNSDASVKGLKGNARPVQNEAARTTVLSSLADVDLVVIFGEETPIDLIRAIKPDVLVKGADYTIETVVGADVVQGYGGRVVLARLEDGHSTTATISRLRAD